MTKIEAWLAEYCENLLDNMDRSGYPGINAVERILRDPGITNYGSGHKVLWWPKNRRIAQMSRAMHHLDPITKVCLVVRFGRVLKPDSVEIYEGRDLVNDSSLTLTEYEDKWRLGKRKLQTILFKDDK